MFQCLGGKGIVTTNGCGLGYLLDLSSRATEVLSDGKHVFNFLVLKSFLCPDVCRNFAANSCDELSR